MIGATKIGGVNMICDLTTSTFGIDACLRLYGLSGLHWTQLRQVGNMRLGITDVEVVDPAGYRERRRKFELLMQRRDRRRLW